MVSRIEQSPSEDIAIDRERLGSSAVNDPLAVTLSAVTRYWLVPCRRNRVGESLSSASLSTLGWTANMTDAVRIVFAQTPEPRQKRDKVGCVK